MKYQLPSLLSTINSGSYVEEENAQKLEKIKETVDKLAVLKKKFDAAKLKKVELVKTKIAIVIEKENAKIGNVAKGMKVTDSANFEVGQQAKLKA